MKKVMFWAMAMFSAACLASTATKAEVSVSNAVSNAAKDAGNSFIRSISDYFSVPQTQVLVVQERSIPDEEIPVVFYLARHTNVSPTTIMELRLKGKSWQEISSLYGQGAEIFYVPVKGSVSVGPPYGNAYGYYRNKPRKEWNKIKLGDNDIVNLVNLKFMSEHYNYPPQTIMKMRQGHKKFYEIRDDIEGQRNANKKNAKAMPAKKVKTVPANVKNQKAAKKQVKHYKSVTKQNKNDQKHGNMTGNMKQTEKENKSEHKENHANSGNNGKHQR